MKIIHGSNHLNYLSFSSELNDIVVESLISLETYYPSIKEWYYHKVLPGIFRSTREILLVADSSCIIGLSIIKKSTIEQKICTLRISDGYCNNGIGTMLLETSINLFSTSTPIISVCDNNLPVIKKLLNRFDFSLTQICPNYYTHGSTEYVFNGLLNSSTEDSRSGNKLDSAVEIVAARV